MDLRKGRRPWIPIKIVGRDQGIKWHICTKPVWTTGHVIALTGDNVANFNRTNFRRSSSSIHVHTPTPSHMLLRQRPFDPRLMPLGELRDNVFFDLLWVSTRVYRVPRDTQPIDTYVTRCGTFMFARNEYHLELTTMKVVSDDEVMSIPLQRGAGFWNKKRGICFKLVESCELRRYANIYIFMY